MLNNTQSGLTKSWQQKKIERLLEECKGLLENKQLLKNKGEEK